MTVSDYYSAAEMLCLRKANLKYFFVSPVWVGRLEIFFLTSSSKDPLILIVNVPNTYIGNKTKLTNHAN